MRSRSRFMRTGHTTPSCGGHSLQRDKTADVVGEVLKADFGFRPSNANRPYDPTTAYPELCLGLGRPISAVRINIRRRIGFVQKPIEFLTVVHARVGHVILPDQ